LHCPLFDTHGLPTYDAANHAVPWPCTPGDALQRGPLRHAPQEDAHMDSHDNLRERLEALEQRTEHWRQQTRTVARRLRWWRGLASGVLLAGLVSLPLPSGIATEEPTEKDNMELRQRVQLLEAQVNALEDKLAAVTFDTTAKELVITGANLRIVNGLGRTGCTDDQGDLMPHCPNSLGNLIVGYNESRQGSDCTPGDPGVCADSRTGSHNVVVGQGQNFSRFGGLVVGRFNEIHGDFASVSGGSRNIARGESASVSGGVGNIASLYTDSISGGADNRASGESTAVCGGSFNIAINQRTAVCGGEGNMASGANASVSGGQNNTASNDFAVVSGGQGNTATGLAAAVSGGQNNTATGLAATVSGGESNTASGTFATVSGGNNNSADGNRTVVSGGAGNTASGHRATVSGGANNTASGDLSAVSGGSNRSAPGRVNWAAGSLLEAQ